MIIARCRKRRDVGGSRHLFSREHAGNDASIDEARGQYVSASQRHYVGNWSKPKAFPKAFCCIIVVRQIHKSAYFFVTSMMQLS
jgi:hypothetical protein